MADIDLHRIEAYQSWLAKLKDRIRVSQLKAAVRVNTELMLVYWQLGRGIVEKQREAGWGDALIEQLSRDLSAAFPEMKGFSKTNLFYVRKWYQFYSRERESVPQLVGLIPWGHNREIVTKCSDVEEALFYVSETIRHGWSRAVLQHQLESGLYRRQGKALNNFALTLPRPQADLATETLKTPITSIFSASALRLGRRTWRTRWPTRSRNFCWSWARASPTWAGSTGSMSEGMTFTWTSCCTTPGCAAMW